MHPAPLRRRGLAAARSLPFLLIVLMLAACGPAAAPAAGPGGGAPPAQVGVVTVQPGPIGLAAELPGRLEAWRVAQVRARVPGIVQKRLFTEGSDVKAGQPLFQLDAATYAAALASAEAALQRSEANLAQAAAQVERNRPLAAAQAISAQDWLTTQTTQKQAAADVASARAAVQTARINLDYASIKSPIAGRVGRALVTEGALVGQGDATQLAVVQQVDPMYVNFTQSTTEVLRLRRELASGKFRRAGGDGGTTVQLLLEDGTPYERPARLLFSDLSVDPSSGQITLRAEVPNPGGVLLPGMYVRVRLPQAQAEAGIALPQQAVQRGATGDSVMVVGSDGKVTPRPVKVGTAVNGQWVVLDGLKPGEQVMVDGFQKLRGNAPVQAVPWQPAGSAATAASAPPAASAASR